MQARENISEMTHKISNTSTTAQFDNVKYTKSTPLIIDIVYCEEIYKIQVNTNDNVENIKDKIQTATGISPEYLEFYDKEGKTLNFKSFLDGHKKTDDVPSIFITSNLDGGGCGKTMCGCFGSLLM